MELFAKALEVVARVMREARLHIRIMTGSGAAQSIIWAAQKNICASGVTAISCRAMCSDAVADHLNLTRAGIIGAPSRQNWFESITVISPLTGRYQRRPRAGLLLASS